MNFLKKIAGKLSKGSPLGKKGTGQPKSPSSFKDGRGLDLSQMPGAQEIDFPPFVSSPKMIEILEKYFWNQNNTVNEANVHQHLADLRQELTDIEFPEDELDGVIDSMEKILPHLESLDRDQLEIFFNRLTGAVDNANDPHTAAEGNSPTTGTGPDDPYSIDAVLQVDQHEAWFSDPVQDADDAINGTDLYTDFDDHHDDIDYTDIDDHHDDIDANGIAGIDTMNHSDTPNES